MKTKLFPLLVALALSASVFARIGETEQEIQARYGKPLLTDAKTTPGQTLELFIADGGMHVAVTLFDGKSVTEVFTKPGDAAFSENEIQVLLDANGGGKKWAKLEGAPLGQLLWSLESGARTASYLQFKKTLVIASDDFLKRDQERKAQAEKEKLKGF